MPLGSAVNTTTAASRAHQLQRRRVARLAADRRQLQIARSLARRRNVRQRQQQSGTMSLTSEEEPESPSPISVSEPNIAPPLLPYRESEIENVETEPPTQSEGFEFGWNGDNTTVLLMSPLNTLSMKTKQEYHQRLQQRKWDRMQRPSTPPVFQRLPSSFPGNERWQMLQDTFESKGLQAPSIILLQNGQTVVV